MRRLLISITLLLIPSLAYAQVSTNVFLRVLRFQSGDRAGTAFTVEVDGKQYVITARHNLPKPGANVHIRLFLVDGTWRSFKARAIYPGNDSVDIVALDVGQKVTVDFSFEPIPDDIILGQQVYFVGYPELLFLLTIPWPKLYLGLAKFDTFGTRQGFDVSSAAYPTPEGGSVLKYKYLPDRVVPWRDRCESNTPEPLMRTTFDGMVMAKDLFAYGTLMCEDIMLAVTGQRFSRNAGFLYDYQRRTIKGEVYPGIIPKQGGVVEGIVYRDVPDAAWALLDTFESEMYQRQIVRVSLADGTSIEAQTYVIGPECENRLGSSEWDFEKFLQSGKKAFETQYAGFKALKNGCRT